MAATIALLNMAAESGGAATLDRAHDTALSMIEGLSVLLAIGRTGLAKNIRHLEQAWREHDVAILAPFTLIDPQRHALAIDVGHLEMDGFGNPQTGCLGRHENCSVL